LKPQGHGRAAAAAGGGAADEGHPQRSGGCIAHPLPHTRHLFLLTGHLLGDVSGLGIDLIIVGYGVLYPRARCGCDVIEFATASMADGTSQPSLNGLVFA